MNRTIYWLGRVLQVLGMILLPVAMAGNLAPDRPLNEQAMLTLTGVGVLVFGIGWLMQQRGRSQ